MMSKLYWKLKTFNRKLPKIVGCELDATIANYAIDNVKKAGLENYIETASEGKQAPLLIDCPWLYSNTINKK